MKPYLYLSVIFLLALSCHKSDPAAPDTSDPNDPGSSDTTTVFSDTSSIGVMFPEDGNYHCTNSPDYGDGIIYAKWKGPHKDAVIKPSNNKNVNGVYYAWPAGLAINSNNGEINVSRSESGIRYVVGFVKSGTQDTCLTEIVLGGATYVDSIYVLSNNDTLVKPFFNANPTPTTICDDGGDDDYPGNSGSNGHGHGNNKCEWDDDDDADGNGAGDEPPPGQQANAKKIRVRTMSGVINLRKTLADGAFGGAPQNGDKVQATIYYRLQDASGKVLQKITVEISFYNKRSDIPAAIVNEIAAKRTEFTQGRLVSPNGRPRPPQIILTRFAN